MFCGFAYLLMFACTIELLNFVPAPAEPTSLSSSSSSSSPVITRHHPHHIHPFIDIATDAVESVFATHRPKLLKRRCCCQYSARFRRSMPHTASYLYPRVQTEHHRWGLRALMSALCQISVCVTLFPSYVDAGQPVRNAAQLHCVDQAAAWVSVTEVCIAPISRRQGKYF